VQDFACGILSEHECCHCAIFAHSIKGDMYVFAKMLDENENVKLLSFSCEKPDFGFFKQIDDIYEFHCYGLVIESQPGQWKIIEK
jgi:hypothetical protein